MRKPLSQKEKTVLQMTWDGLQGKEIAQAMGISCGTVRSYKARLYLKLQVDNNMQLLRRAVELGLVPLTKVSL